jgi:hypothetical protein
MKSFSPTNLLSRSLIGAVGLGVALLGLPQSASAFNIIKGTDFLHTPGNGGTSFDFGTGIDVVTFKGLTIETGNTDTKITRLQDAIFDDNNDGILERTSATINIQLTALSLESIAPVNVGGNLYDVFVGLTANNPSTGTMTISHNTVDLVGGGKGFDNSGTWQGTFTSLFDVNFDAAFIPQSVGSQFTLSNSISLINQGANWTHNPNGVLVRGQIGDDSVNCHNTTGPGCDPGDFFPGPAQHAKGSPGFPDGHGTEVATPEPLTILGSLAALGFGTAFEKKRGKKSKKDQQD